MIGLKQLKMLLNIGLDKINNAINRADSESPQNAISVGGFDGTNIRRIRTDADGYLLIKSV